MTEYALLTFTSLFAIVDPLAAVPTFLAMTARDSVAQRQRMAAVATVTCGFVLAFFAGCGPALFRLLGITMPAFQVAGGLLLLLTSLDMLRAKRSALKETQEEAEAGANKDDIAITPLAIPMLSGPGAITTAILLFHRAEGAFEKAAFFACVAAVSAATYAVLSISAGGAHRISPIAMNIVTRLMGLLLAAVGVQFILSALKLAP
jgi:multiple antibiotic resistance protein